MGDDGRRTMHPGSPPKRILISSHEKHPRAADYVLCACLLPCTLQVTENGSHTLALVWFSSAHVQLTKQNTLNPQPLLTITQ